MSRSFEKYQKRRLRSSYVSVVISIGLVLFLVGTLGLSVLKSKNISTHFKEKVAMTIFLKDKIKRASIKNLENSLKKEPYTKSLQYLSKADAAKQYSEDLGEDFMEFLGENPLKNAIDLYLKADYVTPEQMAVIEEKLLKNTFVAEISYDKPLIELITKNIKRISFWMLLVCAFFTLIAIILINGSIRLSVYSKRFTIKTMQMVGATKRFIRKPFIWNSIRLGIIGALVAIAGLASVVYYIDKRIPELALLKDIELLGYVFGGVLFMGIVITWISTFFATQRFLNLRTDELYY